MGAPDRRAMLETGHGKLSMRRQCALLGVTRSLIYRLSQPANDEDGMSWPRFLWTPICPRRDRNDGVQHDEDRRERSR
jgi:hypothetical protein